MTTTNVPVCLCGCPERRHYRRWGTAFTGGNHGCSEHITCGAFRPADATAAQPAKRWNIWRSGYALNGDGATAPALMHADVEAPTFREACIKAFEGDQCFRAEPHLMFWSCSLFPTREECWDPTAEPWAQKGNPGDAQG